MSINWQLVRPLLETSARWTIQLPQAFLTSQHLLSWPWRGRRQPEKRSSSWDNLLSNMDMAFMMVERCLVWLIPMKSGSLRSCLSVLYGLQKAESQALSGAAREFLMTKSVSVLMNRGSARLISTILIIYWPPPMSFPMP